MTKRSQRLAARIPRLLLTVALLAALVAPAAWADDWEDARKAKLEEALRVLKAAELARERNVPVEQILTSSTNLRHGKVVLVADLARVDLTLEIQNTGAQAMEWSRSFAIDPLAEAIGASLQRGDDEPVHAQTLTIADARRIYGEIRNPRPTRTRPSPNVNGDPLRLERPTRAQLDVVVWPIEAGETVRVRLDFVTPLRGRGNQRTYVDPIQGDRGEVPLRRGVTTAPDRVVAVHAAAMDTSWVIDTGSLEISDSPAVGMTRAGSAGGLHHYVAAGSERRSHPHLPLRVPRPTTEVLAVPGGGLGTRIAVWHLDPVLELERRGWKAPADASVRLRGAIGSCSRIAPHVIEVVDEPVAITARLLPTSHDLRYTLELVSAAGEVLRSDAVERPVTRQAMDTVRSGAITGWHRAALSARVRDWARGDPRRTEQALDFTVDMGVLTTGTAALAVPFDERARLSIRSRRQYFREGAPLGAQDGEADYKGPPSRAVSR